MRAMIRAALAALALAFAAPVPAATIQIVNADGAGEGFNDPTPVAPEGGNSGTTRGQQRLNVFQAAANIWGAQLTSNVVIRVRAQFRSLAPCTPSGGVLGGAGPVNFAFDFPNTPRPGVLYPIALANSLAGSDLDPGGDDIEAEFNSDVDLGCLGGGTRFWYGTTTPAPSGQFVNLLPTVLHEIGHGLGFLSLVCDAPGGCGAGNPQGSMLGGFNDAWNFHLAGSANPSRKWSVMSDAERAALLTSEPSAPSKLVWTGTNVTAALTNGNGVTNGFLRMYAPNPVEPGSSISHFTTAASPNLLMEPNITSTVFAGTDLTVPLFRDIGWAASGGAAPNQAPTINAPGQILVDEDLATTLSGISFADADAGTGALTATFAAPTGTVSATSAGGVVVANIAGGKSLTGTLSAINSFIASGQLAYTTALDAQGTVALAVGVNDNGNTGTGGAQSAGTSISLAIQPVNDAPTLAAPASIPVVEDVVTQLTGISGSDVDAGSAPVSLTFAALSGAIAATGNASVAVSGTASQRVLTGTMAAINAFVAAGNVTYLAAQNPPASVQLGLTLNDNGNTGSGGLRIATANVLLQVSAVNDAPQLSVPAQIATALSGSAPLAGIVLSDVDAANGSVSLAFAVDAGTLAAAPAGGVTVTGSGTAALTLGGTVANIATFLASTPPAFAGPAATLSLTANDNGNTGGSAQTAVASSQLVPTFVFRDGFE
jgi:hypothetical protein